MSNAKYFQSNPNKVYITKDVVKLRKDLGMQPLVIKILNCMKCDDKFESEGHHNRLCIKCRRTKNRQGV